MGILRLFPRLRLRRALARYQRRPGRKESLRLAQAFLRLHRFREALDVATKARRQFADDKNLLEVYQSARDLHARQLLAQTTRALKAEATPENFVRAADLSRTLGDFDRAFQYAREAEARFPNRWEVQFSLGKLCYYLYSTTRDPRDCRAALDHLMAAREMQPEHYGALVYLAITALRLGERELAVAVTEEILYLYPEDPRASQLWAVASGVDEVAEARPESVHGTIPETSLVCPGEPPGGALPEVDVCLSGTVGLYLFDEARELLGAKVKPNDRFALDGDPRSVGTLLDTTDFDSGRAGMGEVRSWIASGDGWSVSLHTVEGSSLLSFFVGTVPHDAIDRQSARILEGSLVT